MKTTAAEYIDMTAAAGKAKDAFGVFRRLVRDSRISHGAFRLWHLLRDHMDGDGKCFPGQRRLAGLMGSKPAHLRKWRTELVGAKYLAFEVPVQGGRSFYTVLNGDETQPGLCTKRDTVTVYQKGHRVCTKRATGTVYQKGHVSKYRKVNPIRKGEAPQSLKMFPGEALRAIQKLEGEITAIKDEHGDRWGSMDSQWKKEITWRKQKIKELRTPAGIAGPAQSETVDVPAQSNKPVDRNRGTFNEGKARLYRDVGKVNSRDAHMYGSAGEQSQLVIAKIQKQQEERTKSLEQPATLPNEPHPTVEPTDYKLASIRGAIAETNRELSQSKKPSERKRLEARLVEQHQVEVERLKELKQ